MGLVRCVFADRPNREFLDGLSLVACHVGILSSLSDGILRRHHRSPAAGEWPAGQDPRAKPHSELRTVPLCSARNASPFSIILLLVFPPGRSWNDHALLSGMSPKLPRAIPAQAASPRYTERAADFLISRSRARAGHSEVVLRACGHAPLSWTET